MQRDSRIASVSLYCLYEMLRVTFVTSIHFLFSLRNNPLIVAIPLRYGRPDKTPAMILEWPLFNHN